MIKQLPGHRSLKWLEDDENSSMPMINYIFSPNFPLTSAVFERDMDRSHQPDSVCWHRPSVIKKLPKPNCSVPSFENSPHLWHFIDTDTEIEFLLYSDGLRKGHYKGTSIEVMTHGEFKQDKKLAAAYSALLEYLLEL